MMKKLNNYEIKTSDCQQTFSFDFLFVLESSNSLSKSPK